LLKSDGKIWVLDNGQDHYTFSETDTDGMVVHRRGGVQYGLGVSSKFIASENDPKEMRPRWNTMLADGYKRNKMTEQDYGSLMTFNDLVFDDISETTISGNKRAKLFFKNGYGISVLFHQNKHCEVAVLKGVEEAWDICYDTSVTGDIIRCHFDEVDGFMEQIQKLDKT
jgi:hypothetical protein